jgi:hypothetical protein
VATHNKAIGSESYAAQIEDSTMPILNTPRARFRIIALACLVAGCATMPPPATSEMDARGKSFAVAQGKANIYLYRNENLSAETMRVSVNSKAAGATGRATYFLWEVDPGIYDISADSENTSNVRIVAEPGKSYYIWQEVKIDRRFFLLGIVIAGSDLHVVDDDTGRWGVSECTRIQSRL